MESTASNAPVIVLRDGPLKASVWENETEKGRYLSTTFAKIYSKNDEVKDGHIFGRNDLLPLSYTEATLTRVTEHLSQLQVLHFLLQFRT